MMDQNLLTDLVIAEMNIRNRIKLNKISYNDEVRKAFKDNEVTSFFDLIVYDMGKAKELRKLAKREHLL